VIRGAEASNLGAAVHGAELRVHFLKSFHEGRICEILSQKGQKKTKKSVSPTCSNMKFFMAVPKEEWQLCGVNAYRERTPARLQTP
jgi:hypothetical protein